MLLPSIVAGSVFTFSLSLGDYIAVDLVGGKTQMIGSVVYTTSPPNLPLAAAFAVVPVIDHGRLPAGASAAPARWRTSDAFTPRRAAASSAA